jgi:hypothetical protein
MKLLQGMILTLAGLALTSLEASAQNKGKENKKAISTLVIYNGDTRTEAYYAPGLSAAEREQLTALSRAGSELAEREQLVADLEDAVRAVTASVIASAASASSGPPAFAYGYEYYSSGPPTLNVNLPAYYSPFLGYPRGLGYQTGTWGYTPPGPYFYPPASASPATSVNLNDLLKALGTAREQVSHAREAYATARSRVVFDNDGQVIGVRSETKGK